MQLISSQAKAATPERRHPVRFGRYEVVALLGEGGMARAYLALSRGPFDATKLVVLKHIRPEIACDTDFVAMFSDEARLALRLAHSNVVQTFEVLHEDGDYVLVMEYLDGRSLGHILRRVGREAMPLNLQLWILTKVLAGLHYAHSLRDFDGSPLSIVHRDVSPANLFVTFDGDVKLLDFGIAKASGAVSTTRQGVIKGKLGYASPEQCLGKTVDHRADVYAVGVLLWEAMARRRRSLGDTELAVLQLRITNGEPPIEEAWPEVPAELAAISARALAFKPEDRYSTAQEFQQDLESYLAKVPSPVGGGDVAELLGRVYEQERTTQAQRIRDCVDAARAVSTSQPTTKRDVSEFQTLPELFSEPLDWDASRSKVVGTLRNRWPVAALGAVGLIAVVSWLMLRQPGDGPPPPLPPTKVHIAAASPSPSASQPAVEPTPPAPAPEPSDSVNSGSRPQPRRGAPRLATKRAALAQATAAGTSFQPGMDLGSPEQGNSPRHIEEQDPYKK